MRVSKGVSRVHLEVQLPRRRPPGMTRKPIVGTWLSLVERTLGVGEVASSNLVVPTIYLQQVSIRKRSNKPQRRSKKVQSPFPCVTLLIVVVFNE
jgi:hypothetical protein